jgi:hypothetical protein
MSKRMLAVIVAMGILVACQVLPLEQSSWLGQNMARCIRISVWILAAVASVSAINTTFSVNRNHQ